MSSYRWGPLEGYESKKGNGYLVGEAMFSKDKLKIDDSWLYPNARETELLNFVRYREFFVTYDAHDQFGE